MAVQSGIDADRFWKLDFGEIMVQIIANNRKRMDDMRLRAMMDHKQAELMMFAFNDPSKMPKVEDIYPFVKDTAPKQVEPVSDWQQDQMELMKQAQKIKTIRKLKNE